MRLQIEDYARNIAGDHNNAADRIADWLKPVEQWYAELQK